MVRVSLVDFPAHRLRATRRSRHRPAADDREQPDSGGGARHPGRGLAGRSPDPGQVPSPPPGEPATGGSPPRALVVLLGTASTVVVLAGLRAVAWLVGPAFLALVLVITLDPVRTWLRGKGLPRWLTVAMLVAAVYSVLLTLFVVVTVSVAQLATVLPRYAGRADELVRSGITLLGRLGVGQSETCGFPPRSTPGNSWGWPGRCWRDSAASSPTWSSCSPCCS